MNKPPRTLGMHHLALFVKHLEETVAFYTEVVGMTIDWQPDPDNVYLSTGRDNLALHRAPPEFTPAKHQHLDHFGFFLSEREEVDLWHEWIQAKQIQILAKPRDHRDGTRSFYCKDPDGNAVQFIYVPKKILS